MYARRAAPGASLSILPPRERFTQDPLNFVLPVLFKKPLRRSRFLHSINRVLQRHQAIADEHRARFGALAKHDERIRLRVLVMIDLLGCAVHRNSGAKGMPSSNVGALAGGMTDCSARSCGDGAGFAAFGCFSRGGARCGTV